MVSNPTQEYNDFIRANLPIGITYDSVRARYVTENGKYFATYLEAKWYLDYITKFGFIPIPASLFANGEPGDAFIPERDFCYTKTSGGVYEPVTTTGDVVARLTGMINGNNADQDVVASRPVYMEGGGLSWLEFDGVDDFLIAPSSAHDAGAATFCASVEAFNKDGFAFGEGELSTGGKAYYLLEVESNLWTAFIRTNDAGPGEISHPNTGISSSGKKVLTVTHDRTGTGQLVHYSGKTEFNTTSSTASMTVDTLAIGALLRNGGGDIFTNMRMFSFISVGRVITENEIFKTADFHASKSGVTI